MAIRHPTEEERQELCEWLTVNGIDISTVPLRDSDLRITEQDGQRVIQYTEYVRSELTGNILSDPHNPKPVTSEASVPCVVDPPGWLNIPEA